MLHKDTVLVVDCYDKYYIYGRDCYIVYYFTGFKIYGKGNNKYINNKIEYLNYLIKILRDNCINYMVLVKRQSYNISDSMFYDNNGYIYYYHKGKIKYKRGKDIDYIIRKLKCNILDDKFTIKYIKELIDNYDL